MSLKWPIFVLVRCQVNQGCDQVTGTVYNCLWIGVVLDELCIETSCDWGTVIVYAVDDDLSPVNNWLKCIVFCNKVVNEVWETCLPAFWLFWFPLTPYCSKNDLEFSLFSFSFIHPKPWIHFRSILKLIHFNLLLTTP